MEIKDLAGLSEPLKKLIEVISAGVGGFSKPYLIRKTADAKAYEINTIAQAIKQNQEELKTIEFTDEKLSLMSSGNDALKNNHSLEKRTQQRVEFKEQKRQKNIESITQKAVENLESECSVSDSPVDEDWTARFFNYAEDISNENMQELWGRILAGEVKKPKSYSLRTLDVLRNLSTEEAEIFIKFGSLAVMSQGSAFLLNFNSEKLLRDKYHFQLEERLLLQELGLLSSTDLRFNIEKTADEKKQAVLVTNDTIIIQEKLANKPDQKIDVIVFTKIGKELLQLIKEKTDIDYIQLLATKLDRVNGPIKYAKIIRYLPDDRVRHSQLIDIPLTDKERADEMTRSQPVN